MKSYIEIMQTLKSQKAHSAWEKGVINTAIDLLKNISDYEVNEISNSSLLKKALLNGASNWSEYSWGGCYLIYNSDIAEMFCTPSELKKTHNGKRKPNKNEEWLDVQARALNQAAKMIITIAFEG